MEEDYQHIRLCLFRRLFGKRIGRFVPMFEILNFTEQDNRMACIAKGVPLHLSPCAILFSNILPLKRGKDMVLNERRSISYAVL